MIEFEVDGRIALLRVCGGRLNIYTRKLHEALCRAMLRFLRDDNLYVAVITSAQGQSWSVGDDIKEIDLPWGDDPDWAEVLLLLPRDKPVVAGVRGYCLGQGLVNLLRLTDIRLASPDAIFGYPEIRLGLGGAGVLTGLDRELPPVIARHLALTGENIDAATAAQFSLINEVVADDVLEARALHVAAQIARHPLAGLRAEMSPLARSLGGRDPLSASCPASCNVARIERVNGCAGRVNRRKGLRHRMRLLTAADGVAAHRACHANIGVRTGCPGQIFNR